MNDKSAPLALEQRFLSILSLCRKAGKLAVGFDSVKEAVSRGDADRIFASTSLSPKTIKELQFICSRYNAEFISVPISPESFGKSVGKTTGTAAVRDNGLSLLLKEAVPQIKEDIAQ